MTTCRITEDGSLEACRPDFAIPEGYGFAEAALKIMPFFRVRAPKGADGKTVSPLTVHVPVRWTLSQ